MTPAIRVTLGLLSLAVCLLLALDFALNIFPARGNIEAQARKQLAESIAVQITSLLAHESRDSVRPVLDELVRRDKRLQSIGVRTADGNLAYATALHPNLWLPASKEEFGRSTFIVPISSVQQAEPWGRVELIFEPISVSFAERYLPPSVQLMGLFVIFASALYYLYLRRTFQHLDPGAAVPERVQLAFDAMNQGVLVLNSAGQIVMANRLFAQLIPQGSGNILGRTPSEFSWLKMGAENISGIPPWLEAMRNKEPIFACAYEASISEHETRKLIVGCAPVMDSTDKVCGCIISFNDVTELDEANKQLLSLYGELAASQEQLQAQNVELKRLASVDPMTGTRNRRSFFPEFEKLFAVAQRDQTPLSFVMADIDKFKSVNDTYGHQIGDKVIQSFADIMLQSVRDTDIVCRYGGEEFCIALPNTDIQQAMIFAERLRETVASKLGPSLPLDEKPLITASFGLSSMSEGALSAEQLADLADQALYHSKRSGRNRCTRYSKMIASIAEKHGNDKAEKRTPAVRQTTQATHKP